MNTLNMLHMCCMWFSEYGLLFLLLFWPIYFITYRVTKCTSEKTFAWLIGLYLLGWGVVFVEKYLMK